MGFRRSTIVRGCGTHTHLIGRAVRSLREVLGWESNPAASHIGTIARRRGIDSLQTPLNEVRQRPNGCLRNSTTMRVVSGGPYRGTLSNLGKTHRKTTTTLRGGTNPREFIALHSLILSWLSLKRWTYLRCDART
jgi:hypothetical protein